ncbi:hypothetical protein FKM82_012773 [Ascaphus truei]
MRRAKCRATQEESSSGGGTCPKYLGVSSMCMGLSILLLIHFNMERK